MNRFLQWLSSLTEAEKSLAKRPPGMSRRGFLKALGITAVSVSTGGVAAAKTVPYVNWRNYAVTYKPCYDDFISKIRKERLKMMREMMNPLYGVAKDSVDGGVLLG